MRCKLDENLAPSLANRLIAHGHDVETVVAEGLGGCTDDALYRRCLAEGRVLITLDLHFANPLRFPPDNGPGIIVLRVGRPTLATVQMLVERMLPALAGQQLAGKTWIVESDRLRVYDPGQA